MKTAILILALIAVAAAAPKATKLHFRNLFKHPVGEIKEKPSPRIIGGQEVTPHSIPYQVFLDFYKSGVLWYCGGSLISPSYVITSGNCAAGSEKVDVILGAHNPLSFEDTQVRVTSTDITIHSGFEEDGFINDISVIKLPETVALTDAIQLVTLPSRADAVNNYAGSTGRISGWGRIDGIVNQISDVLNYVDVQVITNTECEQVYGSLRYSIVCTSGSEATGSCYGDGGGPLIVHGTQIGVSAFVPNNCELGHPSGFTRVTSFLDWIEANTDVEIEP